MGEQGPNLPPGFIFCPTDEELVLHFLYRKAAHISCHPNLIPDIDFYHYDPWELTAMALAGDKEWYFFSHKTVNKASSNGYWKLMGNDEPITSRNKTVGMKKSLVFYCGESPRGVKTNWVMHEYSLTDCGNSRKRGSRKIVSNDWVVCRIYEKDSDSATSYCNDGRELSCLDEVFLSLDDLDEISLPN